MKEYRKYNSIKFSHIQKLFWQDQEKNLRFSLTADFLKAVLMLLIHF